MNMIKTLGILFLFLIIASTSKGQLQDTLFVSDNMTVTILFESNVKDVDVGNFDFVWSKKENMALIKAKIPRAKTTSLMVQTNSNVHVWVVCYKSSLNKLLVDTRVPNPTVVNQKPIEQRVYASNRPIDNQTGTQPTQSVTRPANTPSQSGPNAQSLQEYLKRAEEKYRNFEMPPAISNRASTGNRDFSVKDDLMQRKIFSFFSNPREYGSMAEKRNGLYFSLLDIHVDRQYIYFRISLFNTSSIAFDIDFLSLEIEGKKSFQKRQSNHRKLIPYEYRESVLSIYPDLEETIVIVTDVFSLDVDDKVVFKINELSGSRSLSFSVLGKYIVNAKSL